MGRVVRPVYEEFAAFELGDHDEAAARCLEVREAADATDPVQHAVPLMILANIAATPLRRIDRGGPACRRSGRLGILLSVGAGLRIVRQDFDGARAHAPEAMTLCRQVDDRQGIAGVSTDSPA